MKILNQLSKDMIFRQKIMDLICEHGRENGYKVLKAMRIKWNKDKQCEGITMEWHWPKVVLTPHESPNTVTCQQHNQSKDN